MRKDDLKTVRFAAIICVICSLVLSVTASSLKSRQVKNVELDRKMNVLKAFGVEVVDDKGVKISPEQVEGYFTDHISEVFLDKESGKKLDLTEVPKTEAKAKTIVAKTVLPLYEWKDGEKVTKYAFPTSGMGLWSILYGYVALDKDLATIIGITFYKHAETPGLGGEVSADWFQNQFKGKKIFADNELATFEVVKGTVEGKYPNGSDHAVDGMSGATMTGKGINDFLNQDLKYYERYFSKVRGS